MPSDYTGDPDDFYGTLELPVGSDARTVSSVREPLERLLDNTANVKGAVRSAQMRQALMLRKTGAVFSDTTSFMAAVTVSSVENAPAPVLAIKAGQESQAVYDQPEVENYPGGATPSLTNVRDAAIAGSDDRIVIVGTASPYCAYKLPGGSWTGGGSEPGGALFDVIYSPNYDGFVTYRGSNVWRSPDATAWTSAPAGFTVGAVAPIGNGAGVGRIIALSSATTPAFAISLNDGASFSASGGTVSFAGDVDTGGTMASCPAVSRLGLDSYVYFAARTNSGGSIKLARSPDGVTWEDGPVISAPAGRAFSGSPKLRICQTTGLMVITCAISITADAHAFRVFLASTDWDTWLGVGTAKTNFTNGSTAVAGGRLLVTSGADLYVSDGIQAEVFE